jgi:uncharacterized repeat protein (TIGR03803 family)
VVLIAIMMMVFVATTYGAHAQTYTVLYNFALNYDEDPPVATQVTQGRDGNLYGTACHGALDPWGSVFEITPQGTLTVLYSFTGGTDGSGPCGGLTLGTEGNFYGTTIWSGQRQAAGTVFKITPTGSFTTLYSFTGGSDGGFPMATPIQGGDGNFYGTTAETVFKMTPPGKLTTMYYFGGANGSALWDPLVQGADGNFYGTTARGGTSDAGVVFKITTAGKLTVLHNFDVTHGGYPYAGLVQGSDGSFYGTTTYGGVQCGVYAGCGVIFKITPGGKFTVLHKLRKAKDGAFPSTGLVQATDGNFYGVTGEGGSHNCGTIFRISRTASYSVLYNFDGTTGADPRATLLQHTNGVLYESTTGGGANGAGVFFSLDVGSKAYVSLVSTSGKVGKVIGILGQGFTGTTGVWFNGTPATFTIRRDTYLTATVPDGATTGPVTVAMPTGPLTSNVAFRVKQ